MTKVIGVRFRNAGKVYYFDPKDLELKNGDSVIVETARGMECGRAVFSPREVDDSRVQQPLRPVLRRATESDLEREAENREKEKEAYKVCRQKIREHNLDMKLIQAEYTFDHKKVLFYFTADGRVDFRELVKDLASVFKTRIELRQVGVRDETKMLGGIGICGRPLCCSTYLSDFAPVSIKMAKEQNLSLNPTKISGVCGRLMCCLKNEEETYEYLNKKLPGIGDMVETPDGIVGEVNQVNVLRQTVRVVFTNGDEKEAEDFPASELQILQKRRKGGNNNNNNNNNGGNNSGKNNNDNASGKNTGDAAGKNNGGKENGSGSGDGNRSGGRRNAGGRGRNGNANASGNGAGGAGAKGEKGEKPENSRGDNRNRNNGGANRNGDGSENGGNAENANSNGGNGNGGNGNGGSRRRRNRNRNRSKNAEQSGNGEQRGGGEQRGNSEQRSGGEQRGNGEQRGEAGKSNKGEQE